jgi:hypothetical protein
MLTQAGFAPGDVPATEDGSPRDHGDGA